MVVAPFPANEAERAAAVRATNLLDTLPEERFDRLTRLARRLFGVPMAVVSLIENDRQWFKSADGLEVNQTPRDAAFCAHTILENDIMEVPDAKLDRRFHDNPLVSGNPNIRFYAGCPLSVSGGHNVGALCLLDVKPRDLDEDERALLRDLAAMAEQELAAVRLATTDELTHLSNRRGFELLAQKALDARSRDNQPAELFFFDLDKFKSINDAFGHAEGDRALRAFGQALKQAVGAEGLAARQSGDEFVALIAGAEEASGAQMLGRLAQAIDLENQRLASRGYEIGFSAGRILAPAGEKSSVSDLLSQADAAMYANKQARRSGLAPRA